MGGEKYNSMLGDGGVGVVGCGVWGGAGGGGIYCLVEVPQGRSCQVNILQCTLEGVKTVVGKYIRWKSIQLGYCSGKQTVFIIVVGGG